MSDRASVSQLEAVIGALQEARKLSTDQVESDRLDDRIWDLAGVLQDKRDQVESARLGLLSEERSQAFEAYAALRVTPPQPIGRPRRHDSEVADMARKRRDGETLAQVGRHYGVSGEQIRQLLMSRGWYTNGTSAVERQDEPNSSSPSIDEMLRLSVSQWIKCRYVYGIIADPTRWQ